MVNDGLVRVAFINSHIRTQGSLKEAVQLAGEAGLPAILLTSLTTAAGGTPLMLDESLQAQFLIPMAVALSSGVLFATMVTLVLVPALYFVLDDVRRAFRWLVRGESPRQHGPIPAAAGHRTASGDWPNSIPDSTGRGRDSERPHGGAWSMVVVRSGTALFLRGRESRPATVAPAGSDRSASTRKRNGRAKIFGPDARLHWVVDKAYRRVKGVGARFSNRNDLLGLGEHELRSRRGPLVEVAFGHPLDQIGRCAGLPGAQ